MRTVKWIAVCVLVLCVGGCSSIRGTVCPIIPVPGLCATPAPTPVVAVCVGDCNNDGQIDITDLTIITAIRGGSQPLSNCASADTDHSGTIDPAEQAAVAAHVGPCPK